MGKKKFIDLSALEEMSSSDSLTPNKRALPEYQRLGLTPNTGGKSLLHNEYGFLKENKPKPKEVPLMPEISNEPMSVKASPPVQDDGFIPPKSNFECVGSADHTWYDSNVTGGDNIVDNNDLVDVDSLQGKGNPLEDPQSSSEDEFNSQLEFIKKLSINTISNEINNLTELKNFELFVFGMEGPLVGLLAKSRSLNPDHEAFEKQVEKCSSDLMLEIEAKDAEFSASSSSDDEDVFEYFPDDDILESVSSSTEESLPQSDNNNSCDLDEGDYAVLVDGKVVKTSSSREDTREVLSELVLKNDLSMERIVLIKRIPIDFGILIQE